MGKCTQIVSKLDNYGSGPRLKVHRDETHNTVCGAIMTFITFLVVGGYGCFMAYNMFTFSNTNFTQ